MCGACICVYGFICPCTHLQRLKDDAGCFLLISTIFLRQNLSLNPELGFPARWVASESPVILFHLLLVLGLQACIGDGFLSYMGSGDLNLGSYAYIVKSSNLLNHPLMPWQNIFSLLIWVVDSHDQIDGFFSHCNDFNMTSVPHKCLFVEDFIPMPYSEVGIFEKLWGHANTDLTDRWTHW